MRRIRAIVAALLFASCAAAAPLTDARPLDDKEYQRALWRLEKLDMYRFCARLGQLVRAGKATREHEVAVDVFVSSYGGTKDDLSLIKEKQISVGRPYCIVIAFLGAPSEMIQVGSVSGTVYRLWHREHKAMFYLDEKMRVLRYAM